jgi:hypothetical protein
VSPAKPDQRGTLHRSTTSDRVQHHEAIAMNTSTEIKRSWFVAIVMAAAAAAVVASVTVILMTQEEEDPRLIHLGSQELLARTIPPPHCDSQHHFCITHGTSGNLIALYAYDPHIRDTHPCEVAWHADRDYTNQDGSVTHGTFDDPCGGSKYDLAGHRLFGPSPRDLDSFPFVATTGNSIIVDTRTLVCGKSGQKDTDGCSLVPSK